MDLVKILIIAHCFLNSFSFQISSRELRLPCETIKLNSIQNQHIIISCQIDLNLYFLQYINLIDLIIKNITSSIDINSVETMVSRSSNNLTSGKLLLFQKQLKKLSIFCYSNFILFLLVVKFLELLLFLANSFDYHSEESSFVLLPCEEVKFEWDQYSKNYYFIIPISNNQSISSFYEYYQNGSYKSNIYLEIETVSQILTTQQFIIIFGVNQNSPHKRIFLINKYNNNVTILKDSNSSNFYGMLCNNLLYIVDSQQVLQINLLSNQNYQFLTLNNLIEEILCCGKDLLVIKTSQKQNLKFYNRTNKQYLGSAINKQQQNSKFFSIKSEKDYLVGMLNHKNLIVWNVTGFLPLNEITQLQSKLTDIVEDCSNILAISSVKVAFNSITSFYVFLDDIWMYSFHEGITYPKYMKLCMVEADLINILKNKPQFIDFLSHFLDTSSFQNSNSKYEKIFKFQNQVGMGLNIQKVYCLQASRQILTYGILINILIFGVFLLFRKFSKCVAKKFQNKYSKSLFIFFKDRTYFWVLINIIIDAGFVRLSFYTCNQISELIFFHLENKINCIISVFTGFVLVNYSLIFYILIRRYYKRASRNLLSLSKQKYIGFVLQTILFNYSKILTAFCHSNILKTHQLKMKALIGLTMILSICILYLRKNFINKLVFFLTLLYQMIFLILNILVFLNWKNKNQELIKELVNKLIILLLTIIVIKILESIVRSVIQLKLCQRKIKKDRKIKPLQKLIKDEKKKKKKKLKKVKFALQMNDQNCNLQKQIKIFQKFKRNQNLPTNNKKNKTNRTILLKSNGKVKKVKNSQGLGIQIFQKQKTRKDELF